MKTPWIRFDLSSSDYIEAQISNNLLQLIIQNAAQQLFGVSIRPDWRICVK